MFSTSSLQIGRAESNRRQYDWSVDDRDTMHSVRCSMVDAADFEDHIDDVTGCSSCM